MKEKLVWQRNRFGKETGLTGKMVAQRNSFLVTVAKMAIIILVM